MIKVAVAGAINWDINLFVNRLPEIGEEVPVERITRVPGGKAANVAVASARILGQGRVALIGCLGQDPIAERQIEILKGEGVVVSGIRLLEGTESGQAYIMIDKKGRNVIHTLFGANLRLSPRDLYSPEILRLLYEPSIVTLIDPPLETIERATSIAREHDKTLMWDAGVRSILGIKQLGTILKDIDYLVINQVEIKNLTGKRDPPAAWERLSKINNELKLVAKLGERGCSLIGPDQIIEVSAIDLNKLDMQVINTVGCGDAFLGVFVASKCEGLKDKEALERANLAGALKATKPQTRGSPLKEELNGYLKFKKQGKVTSRV